MKKTEERRREKFFLGISRVRLNAGEKEALQAAAKVFHEQSRRLGLLDPLEAEPAILFFAGEGKR
jgi:hypothetical protein